MRVLPVPHPALHVHFQRAHAIWEVYLDITSDNYPPFDDERSPFSFWQALEAPPSPLKPICIRTSDPRCCNRCLFNVVFRTVCRARLGIVLQPWRFCMGAATGTQTFRQSLTRGFPP